MAYRETGARFSIDRRYRYALWRVWGHTEDLCNFLLLNPSSAAEATNDPTSERCERRARRWGFGGLLVTNLFALCATDPAGLRRVADPIGPENDAAILEAARGAGLVLGAWGHHGAYLDRAAAVRALLAGLGVTPYGLALTKRGEPAHPLYLGYDRPPVPIVDGQWPRDQADTRRINDRPGLGAGPPGRRPDPLPGPRPDATQPGLLPVNRRAGRPRVRRPDRLDRLLELVALLARPGDRQGPSRARFLWLPSSL
jgi:hypothetical protein